MKHFLLTLIVIYNSLGVFSQNCKYKINGVDKFTGQFTRITKPERVIGTFFTTGDLSIKRIDTNYFVIFDYTISSYSDFDPYGINQNAQLLFLLENGDIVTLQSADAIKGAKQVLYLLPTVFTCNLTNVSYPVTPEQLDKLLKSKVKTIRFYRNESTGKEDFIDNEIKKKNQDHIEKLVRCIS